MKKLPARHGPVLFALLLSGVMSLLVSSQRSPDAAQRNPGTPCLHLLHDGEQAGECV